jgi:cytochrome P450
MVFAASHPVHFDSSIYPNAHEFDGFRFEKLRERDSMDIDDSGPRYQLAVASTDYLPWGYGKHACPGRFFAALEMKLIIAHLILNYDVRLEQPGVRPPDFVFEANCMPNAQARILLKRRK